MKSKAEAFSFLDILCQATVVYVIWLIIPCLEKLLLSSLTFLDQNSRELRIERASF
jgi:hypothetical protein